MMRTKHLWLILGIPSVMACMAIRCEKPDKESLDCHLQIAVKNESNKPIYIVSDLIYNYSSVSIYPYGYILREIADDNTAGRKKCLVLSNGVNANAAETDKCYEKIVGEGSGKARLQIYIIDARMADSLNTLDKLIEHNKEICLGTRTFQTMDEMREADFTVTYP